MDDQLIQRVVDEVRSLATNHFVGRLYQLSPLSLALDLGLRGRYLFLSAEPASPRFYLIQRKSKEVEKQSLPLTHFGQLLKAQLSGGQLTNVEKDGGERIVRLTFRVEDELGRMHFRRLLIQLTGRATNLFVLDELNRVKGALRPPKGPGQKPADFYLAPPPSRLAKRRDELLLSGTSPSDAADLHFKTVDSLSAFDSHVQSLRTRLQKAVDQKTRLLKNLEQDLVAHGDPDKHRRLGDLLLANVSTAIRDGNKVQLTDFYADECPTIEVEIDENQALQDAASEFFIRYTKAKRAREEITERVKQLGVELSALNRQHKELEQIALDRDEEALQKLSPRSTPRAQTEKIKRDPQMAGVRRYRSSDGYEILVGRAARDNDNLTFRIARPNDLWLHAGDYPGSHVVIRNPSRQEIPQRTVIEAAQLAGRFSQASADAKVVIHYAQRKYLSKPKGTAPGLVRMSSFKSITVEPKEAVPRI